MRRIGIELIFPWLAFERDRHFSKMYERMSIKISIRAQNVCSWGFITARNRYFRREVAGITPLTRDISYVFSSRSRWYYSAYKRYKVWKSNKLFRTASAEFRQVLYSSSCRWTDDGGEASKCSMCQFTLPTPQCFKITLDASQHSFMNSERWHVNI